jgi:hypothetical protein
LLVLASFGAGLVMACSVDDDPSDGSAAGGAAGTSTGQSGGASGSTSPGGSGSGGAGTAGGPGGGAAGTAAGGTAGAGPVGDLCPTEPSDADLPRCTSADAFLGQVGPGPAFDQIDAGDVHEPNGQLLVLGHVSGQPVGTTALYAVDLESGARTLVSGPDATGTGTTGTGPAFDGGYVRVSPDGTTYVNDTEQLLSVDLSTGERTLVRTWDMASGACFFTVGLFDVASDGTFYHVHASKSMYETGWIRDDGMTCTAFSRCANSARPIDGFGTGQCVSLPDTLLLFDDALWSTDWLTGSLVKVNPMTGDRQPVSRRTYDSATDVGTGSACIRTNGEIAVHGDELWLAGDPSGDDCDITNLALTAVDRASGDRRAITATTGPLTGTAGTAVKLVWKHPSRELLLVSASYGIAMLDPATGRSAYLSR